MVVGILASTEVVWGSEVTTVPPHQALHRPCQKVQGPETLAESHQCCLRCFCIHPPPLGTNLVPGEGSEECQEALCHQLFPLRLAVEVLGFLAAAKEQVVPCREQTTWAVLGGPNALRVLGTAGAHGTCDRAPRLSPLCCAWLIALAWKSQEPCEHEAK